MQKIPAPNPQERRHWLVDRRQRAIRMGAERRSGPLERRLYPIPPARESK